MDEKLSKLLKQLYQLDPSLKQHDSLLRSVLGEVLAAKPDATMDPAFYRNLRETLLSRLREKDTEKVTSPFFSLFTRFGYAFAGLAVVTGVAVLANGIVPHSGTRSLGKEAFGPLSYSAPQGGKGGFGGGGGLDSTMIYFPEERINFAFHYTGDPLTLGDSVDVVKRVLPSNIISSDLNTDSFDADRFEEFNVSSIALTPETEQGYTINFDALSQTFNFTKYHVYSEDCPWGWCVQNTNPLPAESVPSDAELIAVSDAFFEEMGVNRELLGEPFVNPYSPMEGSFVDYSLSVTYPFEINGQSVYSEWGDEMGVLVTLDAHQMQVTYVSNLPASQEFESSTYTAATSAEVLTAAEKGGVRANLWDDPTEVVDLDLGTPTLVYTMIQNNAGTSKDFNYYVPAYSFPILNDTEDRYYGDSIVVPLAKDLMSAPAAPVLMY